MAGQQKAPVGGVTGALLRGESPGRAATGALGSAAAVARVS